MTTPFSIDDDLDNYMLSEGAAVQENAQLPMSVFDLNDDDNKALAIPPTPLFDINTEELFQGCEEETKKRVRFVDDYDEGGSKRQKLEELIGDSVTGEMRQTDEEEEEIDDQLECGDVNRFECDISITENDEEEEEENKQEFIPQRSKSFTMEILVAHLHDIEQLLAHNKCEEAKSKVEYLLEKCHNRTSVRKRVETKRTKKILQGYVHIMCGKRVIGFYSNSYGKPKTVPDMVHVFTIKCAYKNDNLGDITAASIVRDLKKITSCYLYRTQNTPKKHMMVFKHKLEKCIKTISDRLQERRLTVVFENSAWRENLNELTDVQSEMSD
ncbi:hypothetical protein [Mocis latipes granulovirus]|uniref:Uncharacterized protein n=1 Tax=Mocis latipes granulovirus TaxID=2072024 RepID=A0A162GVA9_9BBAC|nr:hypothetical protein [Mocis latipes granulovirus]AKR17407.1 hypothetical protein [Mocis latipes granulovirus]